MRKFYQQALAALKENNLYRSLKISDVTAKNIIYRNGKKLISFASNDYFSLSQNSKVKQAAVLATKKFGCGSGGSRYILGNNSLHQQLEKEVAEFNDCEDCLVFSSGYSAAIGVIPALVGEGDLIVADRLIHSSLIDGAKLSGARLMRFLHNDVAHAERILSENRENYKKCLIITESVFSMDGDLGKIEELQDLASKNNSVFLADFAHQIDFQTLFEKEGGLNSRREFKSGDLAVVEEGNPPTSAALRPPPFSKEVNHPLRGLKMGTFSKAFGSFGGYVCGDFELIDYLRNFAKSQIYSTALPPAVLAASLASLQIIKGQNFSKKLLENSNYFCRLMNLPESHSAIVPIILGCEQKVLEIAAAVEKEGMLISAIRPPTVEKGKARLRITFSATHSKKHIKKLVQILQNLGVSFS